MNAFYLPVTGFVSIAAESEAEAIESFKAAIADLGHDSGDTYLRALRDNVLRTLEVEKSKVREICSESKD